MTKDFVITTSLGVGDFNPAYTMTFHRHDKVIATLNFNGPVMTFDGEMDASAELFMNLVATAFESRLAKERAEEREACAKVCEELVAHTDPNKERDGWPAAVACTLAIRARGEK